MRTIILLFIVTTTLSYLDIPMILREKQERVNYAVEMPINGLTYNLAITLVDREEHIQNYVQLKALKPQKTANTEQSDSSNLIGHLNTTSFEGNTVKGWLRFFIEVITFIDQRYQQNISIQMSNIKQIDPSQNQTKGLISLGPSLKHANIYRSIKNQYNFGSSDIVGIYHGNDDIRMQLGGFEEKYMKGMKDSIFGQVSMSVIDKNESKLIGLRVQNLQLKVYGKQNFIYEKIIGQPQIFILDIQSKQMIVSEDQLKEIVNILNSNNFNCTMPQSTQDYLKCSNFIGIESSLTYLCFNFKNNINLNASFHWFIKSYDDTTKISTFYLRYDHTNSLKIGATILRQNYLAIDYTRNVVMFSPINFYRSQITSVEYVRIALYFFIFLILSAIGIMLYQFFLDPYKNNQINMVEGGGIEIITYQKPSSIDFQ